MEVKNAWRYTSNPSYTSTAQEFFLLHRNAFRDCMVTWSFMTDDAPHILTVDTRGTDRNEVTTEQTQRVHEYKTREAM